MTRQAEGCRREVCEELGLSLELGPLLLVDWVSLADDPNGQLLFAYDGGVLTDEQIQRITLPDDELRSFRFVACESLGSYVRNGNVIRIKSRTPCVRLWMGRSRRSTGSERVQVAFTSQFGAPLMIIER